MGRPVPPLVPKMVRSTVPPPTAPREQSNITITNTTTVSALRNDQRENVRRAVMAMVNDIAARSILDAGVSAEQASEAFATLGRGHQPLRQETVFTVVEFSGAPVQVREKRAVLTLWWLRMRDIGRALAPGWWHELERKKQAQTIKKPKRRLKLRS